MLPRTQVSIFPDTLGLLLPSPPSPAPWDPDPAPKATKLLLYMINLV